MSLVPRYNYPSGTEVTLFSQEMALNAVTDDGYELTNIQSGNVSVVSFAKFAEYLKSPAMHVENTNGISANAVELRLGGFKVAEQLAKFQQEL